MKSSSSLNSTIAVRHLTALVGNKEVPVRITIGKPKRTGDHWVCLFKITGLRDHSKIYTGYGVDSAQALISAISGIRSILDKSKERLRWLGRIGDTGFYRMTGAGFPLPIQSHLERIVEIETTKMVRKKKRPR